MLSSDCYEATPAVLALPLFENLKCVAMFGLGTVYMSPTWRAGPTMRDTASSAYYLKSLPKNCLRLHVRRVPALAPGRDLAIAYPISRLVGLEISQPRTQGRGGIKTLAYEAALLLGLVRKFSTITSRQLNIVLGLNILIKRIFKKLSLTRIRRLFVVYMPRRLVFLM